MHLDVLNDNQKQLLPLIATFAPQFGLVGGTAIALYLGHRRSIDFDLFTLHTFDIQQVKTQIRRTAEIGHTFIESIRLGETGKMERLCRFIFSLKTVSLD